MSLPKPYYQDDAVTLYHGDCREIVPLLGKFDLLLTDPPYGMNYSSARRTKHQRLGGIHGDDAFPKWVFEYQVNNAAFIFCRWDNLHEIPKPKSFIVWDKECHSMGDLEHEYGRQWEACAFYTFDGHKFTKRPVDVIRVARVAPTQLLHPTEKPVELIRQLLVSNVGETVLDPFAGSGTTGRACKDLGRKCVMIEREEKYCEIAAKRMRQEVLPL